MVIATRLLSTMPLGIDINVVCRRGIGMDQYGDDSIEARRAQVCFVVEAREFSKMYRWMIKVDKKCWYTEPSPQHIEMSG